MGFGMLFRLDESSLGSHLNERRIRGEEEGINEKEETEEFKELSDSESEDKVSEKKHDLPLGTTPESTIEEPKLEISSTAGGPGSSPNLFDDKDINNPQSSVEASATFNSETSETTVNSVTPQLEDLLDRALELGPASASAKNYGFQGSQEETAQENLEDGKSAQREKPYVSKAERRKQKKGQKCESVNGSDDHGKKQAVNNSETLSESDKQNQSSRPGGGGKLSRGQKGKLKKMKEKYADQDEEERRIRMALLAVSTSIFLASFLQ